MAKPRKTRQTELQRIAKNYNAKIRRLEKLGVPASQLPARMKIRGTETAKEYAQIKDMARIFTNRANTKYQFKQYGEDLISVKELNEVKALQKRVNTEEKRLFNRNKNKQFRVISEESQGLKSTPRTVAQDRHKTLPLQYTKNQFKSYEEFQKYKEGLKKALNRLDKNDEKLKENIGQAIDKRFGKAGQKLKNKLNSLDAETVGLLYETTDILNFDFIGSDPAGDISDLSDDDKLELLDFLIDSVL